jgi:hypothetical protein
MALEKRGKKITTQSQSDAAWRMVADKWEKLADQRFDTFPGGPRAGEKTRGPGKKNTAKMDKLKKIAGVGRKKINSNPAKNASGSTGKQAIKAISKARGGKTKVSPMAKVRKPGNFRGRGGAIGGGFLDQLK